MKAVILCILLLIGTPFLVLISSQQLIAPSHNSGVFNDDIELSFGLSPGVEIFYHFGESLDHNPVKYVFPLSLTAMKGESRKYTLNISAVSDQKMLKTITLEYIIDKDIPEKPGLNKTDGIYNDSLYVEFIDRGEEIFYSLKTKDQEGFNQWDGEPILIEHSDSVKTELIMSYSRDSAGNKSSVGVNSFTILPGPEKHQTLQILSPVDGNFMNSQLLYIDTTGYRWIRYSLNDVNPVTRGTSYLNPVLFITPGKYKLNVAALPLESENILSREINFSISGNSDVLLNRMSGIYIEDIELKFDIRNMNYNFEDREVVSSDPVLPDKLSLISIPGIVKYKALRISESLKENEYRYFFILDNRIPAAPLISLASEPPLATDTEVRILAVPGTDIYYTLDGSTPDLYSAYYKRPFILDIPDGLSSGSMIIKAIAYFSDKSTSLVSSKLIGFDIKKPEQPILNVTGEDRTQVSFSITNSLSNRIIYNVTYDGSEPEDPLASSFTGSSEMILSVPHGIMADINFKVALIDRAGNISDSTSLNLMKVDTVPPGLPDIKFSDGLITLSGEGRIFYKLEGNQKVPSNDFLLYENPIEQADLVNDFFNISVTAYSEDENGNLSELLNSEKLIIDNRMPEIPRYTGVSDGALYNDPRSMRFHSSDKIRVYYTVSSDKNLPLDPTIENNSVEDDYIYFDCPAGESREYTVKLAASSGPDRPLSKVDIISFTIDRIVPDIPVITSVINGFIYNEDVIIRIEEQEDEVWVLIKDQIIPEDLNYTNFKANGILLTDKYILKTDIGFEKHYQLAALAIDKAGNTSLTGNIINFTIDKISPDPPVIEIKNEIQGNRLIIRITGGESERIVCTVSEDGSYPDNPDENSNIYSQPIILTGNTSNVIYIKARSIDVAGNLSSVTTKKVTVTSREDNQLPLIDIQKLSSSEFIISFATVTGRKIFLKQENGFFVEYIFPVIINLRENDHMDLFYYSEGKEAVRSSIGRAKIEKSTSNGDIITGVSNNKTYNTGITISKANPSRVVRYEVAINGDSPKKVTVFSPELTEPVFFDSAEGETLVVSINVKEFLNLISDQGNFDTDIRFTIDKTIPPVPEITGIEDQYFYQNDRIVELKSNEDIYYRNTSKTSDSKVSDFIKYSGVIDFITPEGDFDIFKIEAYSEDEAGNRSKLKIWKFTIDKANIYVSASGKDNLEGTRLKPFKTIDRALEFSNITNRKVIYLEEGEYILESVMFLEDDIQVYGGFKAGDWNDDSGQSIINITKQSSGNSAMINIKSGRTLLAGLTLTNVNLNAPMANVTGGSLVLDKVKLFHANGSTPVSLAVKNSEMTLKNTELIFGPLSRGRIIDVKNSILSLENTNIYGTGRSGILNIFDLTDSDINISNSYINPFQGQKINIIEAKTSNIRIDNTIFDTGHAAVNATIITVKDGSLNMSSSEFTSQSTGSRIFSGFELENASINIDSCRFDLKGESGISFARMSDSSFTLSNTDIIAGAALEFVYLIKSETSEVTLNGNNITAMASDTFIGIDLQNSVSSFSGNTVNLSGGRTVSKAFTFNNPMKIDFTNNILSNAVDKLNLQYNKPVFNIRGGNENVILKGNNLVGWDTILKHNDNIIRSIDELNNYRGFLDIPVGNF